MPHAHAPGGGLTGAGTAGRGRGGTAGKGRGDPGGLPEPSLLGREGLWRRGPSGFCAGRSNDGRCLGEAGILTPALFLTSGVWRGGLILGLVPGPLFLGFLLNFCFVLVHVCLIHDVGPG